MTEFIVNAHFDEQGENIEKVMSDILIEIKQNSASAF